ncbi:MULTISPECIES: azurin [Pseudomonas]|uniref:Azurin n=1 Tax=Pseudomonas flexibilis TaxID=706570 RepID=A0A0B3BJ71_9PSED|nr:MULTISPECIES: azurin [Pseudomonas]KHL70744.1 azurin [Pseudomonas flexibilis]KHO64528.1 azurin [Pseudomonas flexibilis]SCY03561.1 azurin [Pseudomonas flexibilis]SIP86373.1 azurin [Pseudomonas flexibilis]
MIRRLALVALLSLPAAPLWAAECSVDIDSTDQMTYSTNAIEIAKSCQQFTVNLKHVGQLPKNVMGHNWVLTRQADMTPVVNEGAAAGLDNDYLKADDSRILAHTKMIGGGESTSVTFDVAQLQADGQYMFFCTFPGHAAVMKGTVTLVD